MQPDTNAEDHWPAAACLLDMPNQVLGRILSRVDIRDRARCRQVCRRLLLAFDLCKQTYMQVEVLDPALPLPKALVRDVRRLDLLPKLLARVQGRKALAVRCSRPSKARESPERTAIAVDFTVRYLRSFCRSVAYLSIWSDAARRQLRRGAAMPAEAAALEGEPAAAGAALGGERTAARQAGEPTAAQQAELLRTIADLPCRQLAVLELHCRVHSQLVHSGRSELAQALAVAPGLAQLSLAVELHSPGCDLRWIPRTVALTLAVTCRGAAAPLAAGPLQRLIISVPGLLAQGPLHLGWALDLAPLTALHAALGVPASPAAWALLAWLLDASSAALTAVTIAAGRLPAQAAAALPRHLRRLPRLRSLALRCQPCFAPAAGRVLLDLTPLAALTKLSVEAAAGDELLVKVPSGLRTMALLGCSASAYPAGLRKLLLAWHDGVPGCRRRTSLGALPRGLRCLALRKTALHQLQSLPSGLEELELSHCDVPELPLAMPLALPLALQALTLSESCGAGGRPPLQLLRAVESQASLTHLQLRVGSTCAGWSVPDAAAGAQALSLTALTQLRCVSLSIPVPVALPRVPHLARLEIGREQSAPVSFPPPPCSSCSSQAAVPPLALRRADDSARPPTARQEVVIGDLHVDSCVLWSQYPALFHSLDGWEGVRVLKRSGDNLLAPVLLLYG